MAKLKISKALVTFPMAVDIPTPNGDDQVNFTAKHLKASEWSKLREAHTETVNAAVKALFDAAQKAAEDEYAASRPVQRAHWPTQPGAVAAGRACWACSVLPVACSDLALRRV